MNIQYFTIQNFPDDVYNAIGQIIKSSQELEQKYKKLACALCIPVKNINKLSLNKLNEALKKYNQINENHYEKLKNVIKMRNYINHEFYLTDFENSTCDYDQYIEQLEYKLNDFQANIFEAIDFIDNNIDKLQGISIMRQTKID